MITPWNIAMEAKLNNAIALITPYLTPGDAMDPIGGACSEISDVAAVLHNLSDGWIRDRKPTLADADGEYVWAYEPSNKKHPVRSMLWTYVAAHGIIWRPIIRKPDIPTEFK